ncbi:MAG: rhodanese-like domain-containing protein [Flavobacteriaceae bacterium]
MKQLIYILFLYTAIGTAQNSSFDAMINNTLQKSIPFITAKDLLNNYDNYTILDTREIDEYNTSHLKNAIHIGYNHFNSDKTTSTLNTNQPVVVYCSVGYRSEKIAEKLHKKGYTVYNLYGGIFNWKNEKNTVVDSSGQKTNNVHCYNKEWSKWLTNGVKIYE